MLIYLSILENEEDSKSFEKIYQDNYLKMYHVAFLVLKQQADAENAVHEAFVSLARNYHRYNKLLPNEMQGLCINIVKNKAIDILREQKRLSDEDINNLVLYQRDSSLEPEIYVEKQEEAKEIRALLEKLPDILKITLDLKYYYDFSNGEIAKMLGVSTKTVEMRLYRGKKKMRELLEKEFGKR